MKTPDLAPLTSKGEQTRAAILETALRLFADRGYEQTTMRAVAEGAGVSLGNAYYYFKSKEHLIQAFYQRSHEEHLRAVEEPLARETTLAGRLRAVLRTKIDSSDPHHRFAAQLFRTAADPESPLNPFSPDSAPVRDQAIALFDRVLAGSDVKVPEDLRKELPRLLWMWKMGIILFWIHDRSEGRRRTRRLADRTSDLVARLVSLASNPLLRPIRRLVLDVVKDLDEDRGP